MTRDTKQAGRHRERELRSESTGAIKARLVTRFAFSIQGSRNRGERS